MFVYVVKNKTNLIMLVLMDGLDNFVDADLVRPPSINTARSSSLIVSLSNAARLLSEWLLGRKASHISYEMISRINLW